MMCLTDCFKRVVIPAILVASGVTAGAEVAGIEARSDPSSDIADISLEDLINIRVTSVSKKETMLQHSAAAISVITQEDIQRSGLSSIPEALRMVPGLNVARINASEWAISSRGFNEQYGNKLLVLIDGRTVYNPSFGGVYWNAQDVLMEDLDRIEVIRGPGATLWGANAVNGVINIITKSARDTQGLLVSTSMGTLEQPSSSLRYGGQLGTNLFYRAYVKQINHDNFSDSFGNARPDDWNALRGGVRLDWHPTEDDHFTLQGDYYNGDFGQGTQNAILSPPFSMDYEGDNNNYGGNVIGRWTHDFSETSQLTAQFYFDHVVNQDMGAKGTLNVYDFDLQHRFKLGERHDIVWGTGYRYFPYSQSPNVFVSFVPSEHEGHLYNAFIQDEISVVEDRLALTLGTKVEHHDFTGFEYEPSGRLLWRPTEKQTVWSAVSRAVRIPSQVDRGSRVILSTFPEPNTGLPGRAVLSGNPKLESEQVIAYELGYRIDPTPRLSFDLAAFYNVYDNLRRVEPGTPFFQGTPTPHVEVPFQFQNSLAANTYGTEISARWMVTDSWRLMANYTWLHMHMDNPLERTAGENAQNQFSLRSYWDLPHNLQLNAAAYYVDNLPGLNIDSYVRLDIGLVWRPNESWEFGIWGQNLLEDSHPEISTIRTRVVTEIPRSVLGKVTFRF